jgi:hypothetical protein
MGLPEDCLYPVGATRYKRPGSSKEGDTAYCPLPARELETDWPTIVLESGASETLTRLRHDAQWWIVNSGGDVNIVIIISIKPAQKTVLVEKWCPSPAPGYRPATRAHPNPNTPIPTKVRELTITQNPTPQLRTTLHSNTIAQPIVTVQPGTVSAYDIAGAPLILEFDKIFLRTAVPPNESDVVFSAADLALWVDYFWKGVK